jgi:nucleoside-diphosphate-sugar epimerase
MVFVSTIKVNGESTSEVGTFRETDVPIPQDAYALSKFEAEEILRKIGKETSLATVILRLPLVYGPGVKANFLRLIKLVDIGIPLPLKKLNNKRSLVYLGNLVDALWYCVDDEKAANQTFLVSDGTDLSTPELISMISQALNKRARMVAFPINILQGLAKLTGQAQEMDRLAGSLAVNIGKIKSVLGWKPPFSTKAGIKETVNWYKSIKER